MSLVVLDYVEKRLDLKIITFCMGPKKQGFWPRIYCSQMKLPDFESPSGDSLSKIGRHFSNKVVLKLKSAKNAFYKKGVPKSIFFNEKKKSERFGRFLT